MSKLADDLLKLIDRFPMSLFQHHEFLERVASELERLTEHCAKQHAELNDLFSASVTIEVLTKEVERLSAELTSQKAENERLKIDVTATGPDRCPVCNWPMASSAELGCVPGNCAMRK